MHKRTTPKIFRRAKELHRNMSPAEAQLWKHLRAHQMGDIHFRNHTCPERKCRGVLLRTLRVLPPEGRRARGVLRKFEEE